MEVKTLRYPDKQTAFQQIKTEYGPDAVILTTKMVHSKSGLFGFMSPKVCEVTVAYPSPSEASRLSAPARSSQTSAALNAARNQFNSLSSRTDSRVETSANDKFDKWLPPELPSNQQSAQPAKIVNAPSNNKVQAAEPSAMNVLKDERAAMQKRLQNSSVNDIYSPSHSAQAATYSSQLGPLIAARAAKAVQPSAVAPAPPAPAAPLEEQECRSNINAKKSMYGSGTVIANAKVELDHLSSSNVEFDEKLDEIRNMLQRFTDRLEYANYNIEDGYSADVAELLSRFVGSGVDVNTAHDLARQCQRMIDSVQANASKAMRLILRSLLGEPKYIKCEHGRNHVVMLIGPTGVGKTTTLAKLAANFSIRQNYRVGVINADIFRIAAQDQLNAYADIMNLPCITVHSTEEMQDALRQFADMELIFVDTTGRVSSDMEYQKQVKEYIELCNIDQVFLTLSSIIASRVIKEIITQHSFINDYGIIVTKTDEDVSLGNFINICKYSGKPLGYYTIGQNVPDDIRNVDIDELINNLMR